MVTTAFVVGFCLLTGCYRTPVKLFDSGLDAGLASGKYECVIPNSTGPIRLSLYKQNANAKDVLYAFKDETRLGGLEAVARLGKLRSGQHLIQIEGRELAMVEYSFITIATQKSFLLSVTAFDTAFPKAKSFGLSLSHIDETPWSGGLTGSPAATQEFFESFKPDELSVVLTCHHYEA